MTKLQPPATRDQTIPRQRLLDGLRPHGGTKLTLVAAPAGCGKSTLLAEWRAHEMRRRPVAWLNLDEADDDPLVLWTYVLEALRDVLRGFAIPLEPARVGPARLVSVVLPTLVNELARHGAAALVLEDFHRLGNGPGRDSVAWLVEHAPPSFQLVISTRSEPALRLARMRARGELLEVRADGLAFTSEEADALLNERLRLGLSRADVDGLVERTEGWAAGVYLAALSLRGTDDRAALLRKFGGASRYVIDYLVDEVLSVHDPATQSLMLRSSILERLSGPLCDAVLETNGSAARLSALSRSNLFLLPLDDHGEWYRFHHLFGQLLRVELEHRDPGLVPTLHGRAHQWYRDNGRSDAAIEHALLAGAYVDAGELIVAAWPSYASTGRSSTVLGWIRRIPRSRVLEDLRLSLAGAWAESLCGRRDVAAAAIAAVESGGRLDEGPLPDGFSSVDASLTTLRAVFPWGDVGAGLASALRAVELEGPGSPWRPVVCWALGSGHYFRGELDEADRWYQEAAVLAASKRQWVVATSALAHRSLIAGESGRLDEQERLAAEAATLARERRVEEVDGAAHQAVGMSMGARGNVRDAAPLLDRAVTVLRSRGQPLGLVNALVAQAWTLRAIGERAGASVAIAEATAVVAACPDPGILRQRLTAVTQATRPRSRSRTSELSERERVVLRLLRGPLSERDIGRELHLSHNTVHSHTRAIYRKLGVTARADAVQQARVLHLL